MISNGKNKQERIPVKFERVYRGKAGEEVVKKSTRKPRHIPQRTCVGCREVLAKRTLIRIVRTPEGIRIDLTGKLDGRGAYLHDQRSCWEIGLKGALANSLKVDLTNDDRELLKQYMEKLPAQAVSPKAG